MAPNELHIASSAGWFLRALGVPFILFACYLLNIFLSGIGEYVVHATLAEWLAALPGFAILCLLGLIFMAPGWLLAFTRVRVELDASRGTIREVRDFLLHEIVIDHDLGSFDRVEVALEEIKYRHREGGSYKTLTTNQITLRGESEEKVVVGLVDNDEAAEQLGQEIAGLLGLAYAGNYSNEPTKPT